MTTRLTTLLGSCLFLVVACGDDGGNNPGDTCGDGDRTGTEQCDDGNTNNGDGCSATCRNESSGPVCGDGVMSGNEECDDSNTTPGDGCSATCMNESPPNDCGNGMIDGTEACDDNNTVANDGCTACAVDTGWTCDNGEPSVCMMDIPPNGMCSSPFVIALTDNAGTLSGMVTGDTSTSTNQFAAGPCDAFNDSGAGKDIQYKFTLPAPKDVYITLTATWDAVIRVTTTPCDRTTEVPEFTGVDGCSDSLEFLGYIKLPAGTYYVNVDGYDASDEGSFMLDILAEPTRCGNGTFEGPDDDFLEFCDDNNAANGDGCNDKCEVEADFSCTEDSPSVCVALCGNGEIDAGEECDDDGTANGDGCSATCVLEYDVLEAEDNDTVPQALTAANHIIKGSLDAADVDLYTFTLAAPARVEIETYVTIDAANAYGGVGNPKYDCDDGVEVLVDTVLHVFAAGADVTMDDLALISDDEDGDARCSYIGGNDSADDDVVGDIADPTQGMLPAGTYTIKVVDYFGDVAPRYLIDFRIIQTVAAGDLAINEFMAADNMSDTNCDNSTTNTVDEFVEIVNKGTHTVDLTGVTISDVATLRHTFAPGATGSMLLDPGKAVVVWGGGSPACPGVNNWFVASSNSLGLNDDGDTITVATGGGVQLAQYAYPAQTANVSSNLDVDITGTAYMRHNLVTGHVGDFTPGKRVNDTPF